MSFLGADLIVNIVYYPVYRTEVEGRALFAFVCVWGHLVALVRDRSFDVNYVEQLHTDSLLYNLVTKDVWCEEFFGFLLSFLSFTFIRFYVTFIT